VRNSNQKGLIVSQVVALETNVRLRRPRHPVMALGGTVTAIRRVALAFIVRMIALADIVLRRVASARATQPVAQKSAKGSISEISFSVFAAE